jgi:DNA-binding response OmpR family regulator
VPRFAAISDQAFCFFAQKSAGSGIDLCREIRVFDKATPIVFYSGFSSEKDEAEGLAAGAQAYLQKPGDLNKLVALIKDLTRSDCKPLPLRESRLTESPVATNHR